MVEGHVFIAFSSIGIREVAGVGPQLGVYSSPAFPLALGFSFSLPELCPLHYLDIQGHQNPIVTCNQYLSPNFEEVWNNGYKLQSFES